MQSIKAHLKRHKSENFGLKIKNCENTENAYLVYIVDSGGIAFQNDIREGDIIVKINGKKINNKKDWINDINSSKPNSIDLSIERNNSNTSRHMSLSGINKSLSSNNSYGSQIALSNSTMDLQLGDNFVNESIINEFIQPANSQENLDISPNSNRHFRPFDGSLNDINNDDKFEVNIIKKSAYNKKSSINLNYSSTEPRIQRKQATKPIGVPTIPDTKINYVLRRKTAYNENPNSSFNRYKMSAQANNNSNSPNDRSMIKSKTAIFNSSQPENIDTINSSMVASDSMSNLQSYNKYPTNLTTSTEVLNSSINESNINPEFEESPDVDIKIFSFFEKIKKPCFKNFTLEQEPIGVMFKCLKLENMQISCNSTALDPRFVTLSLFISAYQTNNSCWRFLLPIQQESTYSHDIIVSATVNNIRINWSRYNIDLLINISKLKPNQIRTLFALLKIEALPLPPVKVPQSSSTYSLSGTTKHRKPTSLPLDNSSKPDKKSKTYKTTPESARNLLSLLPRSNKVKDVPLVIVLGTSIIEKCGMKEEGIYRKTGNIADRKRLEENINKEDPCKWKDYTEWFKVHTVASLLKSVMNNYKLVDKDTAIRLSVIRIDRNSGELDDRVQACMDMLYHFRWLFNISSTTVSSSDNTLENSCRLNTFVYLMKHLNRLVHHTSHSRMNSENLATCWQPNIIEDIPLDIEDQQQNLQFAQSKRFLADNNLRKIIQFWIDNADILSEFLEETQEDVLMKNIKRFMDQNNIGNSTSTITTTFETDLDEERDDFLIDEKADSSQDLSESNQDDLNYGENIKSILGFYCVKNSIIYTKENIESHITDVSSKSTEMFNVNPFTRNSSNNTSSQSSPYYQSFRNNSNTKKQLIRRSSSISPTNRRKTEPQDVTLKSSVDDVIMKQVFIHKKKKNSDNDLVFSFDNIYLSGTNQNVPLSIEICVEIIEKYAMNMEGIYRKNGKQISIQRLKEIIKSNEISHWTQAETLELWSNPYVTSCLLKSLLKEMCLISINSSINLLSSLSTPSNSQSSPTQSMSTGSLAQQEYTTPTELTQAQIKKVLQTAVYNFRTQDTHSSNSINNSSSHSNSNSSQLNQSTNEMCIRTHTLIYVLQHLSRLTQHSPQNRMNTFSVAVCFTPVLIQHHEDSCTQIHLSAFNSSSSGLTEQIKKNTKIVELLIKHIDWITTWTSESCYKKIVGAEMTSSLDAYLNKSNLSSTVNEILGNVSSLTNKDYLDDENIPTNEILQLIEPLVRNAVHSTNNIGSAGNTEFIGSSNFKSDNKKYI